MPPDVGEDLQRLVHRIDPHDRRARVFEVRPDAVEEPRRPRLARSCSTSTCAIAIRFLPAWMIDSSVYEKSETMVIRSAASRVYARNPLVVSGTVVFDTWRTVQLPNRCSSFFGHDMCRIVADVPIADDDVGLA